MTGAFRKQICTVRGKNVKALRNMECQHPWFSFNRRGRIHGNENPIESPIRRNDRFSGEEAVIMVATGL